MTLRQVTEAMGLALKDLETRGLKIDERSTRLWADAVVDRLKQIEVKAAIAGE